MKEIIKKKMDEHIDRILAKEEITNEDYYLLNMLYQKIEGEEKLAEMEAQKEANRAELEESKKQLCELFSKSIFN